MNQKGLSTLQTFVWKVIKIFGVVVLTIGMFPSSAMAADFDLTQPGDTETINGAIFIQYDPSESAGTGNFDPFLQIDASPIERGYNTDGTIEFDTKGQTSGNTHSLKLSNIPLVFVGGIWYREFQIDVNENDLLIDLTELQVFTATVQTLSGYQPASGGDDPYIGTPTATTLIYDLDAGVDNTAQLAYLQSGSGEADYLVLIPDDSFSSDPNCDFGGTGCSTYVYWYANLGEEDPPSIPPLRS